MSTRSHPSPTAGTWAQPYPRPYPLGALNHSLFHPTQRPRHSYYK